MPGTATLHITGDRPLTQDDARRVRAYLAEQGVRARVGLEAVPDGRVALVVTTSEREAGPEAQWIPLVIWGVTAVVGLVGSIWWVTYKSDDAVRNIGDAILPYLLIGGGVLALVAYSFRAGRR